MRFILASASPRRGELLRKVLDDFDIIPSQASEKTDSEFIDDMVIENALAKANDIARQHPDAIVFGFDTVVVHNDRVMGKPGNLEHAKQMLNELSGSRHDVFTGHVIVHRARYVEINNVTITGIAFKPLTGEQIDAYVEEFRPLDKAGAYDIAEIPEEWVDMIMGSYSNVRGLPLDEFYAAFKCYLDELVYEIENPE